MLPDDFKIRIDDLKKGSRTIRRDIPLDWLNEEMKCCEFEVTPVSARCDISVQLVPPANVLVRGTAAVVLKTPCSTCLEEVVLNLETEVDAFLAPLGDRGVEDDDGEFTPEDLQREWYEGDEIILDDLIRDGIMLELPMTPRCEGTCRHIEGLITAEEAAKREQKIDPRLAALSDFKLSKES